MAELPSYDESVGEKELSFGGDYSDSKTAQRYSIRDEVSVSRSQHVAVLVSKVLPAIKERARQGIARSTLVLIPSDQVDNCAKGELVGFPDDNQPALIQLQGRFDSTQFWTQQEALELLRQQMFEAVCGELPEPEVEPLPEILPPPPPKPTKSSWFGRKQSAQNVVDPVPVVVPKPKKAPVSIEVRMDQVSFRSESEYGLYETTRARAVEVTVDVRT